MDWKFFLEFKNFKKIPLGFPFKNILIGIMCANNETLFETRSETLFWKKKQNKLYNNEKKLQDHA